MCINRSNHTWRCAWFAAWLFACLGSTLVFAQAPPPDIKPVSINLEEVPYPHPVSYLPLTMYGQDVLMAYMDVPPVGQPNGRTVVLLHGSSFYGEYWAATIEVLRKEGFRVVVPDQIGYGRSSKPIIPYTLHDMAANTRAILQKLGIAEAAIVGHSLGGSVATRFAFAYPEMTTHLALVNPWSLEDARIQRPWRSTDEVYKSNLKPRSYEAMLQGLKSYFVTWKPEYERYVRIQYGLTLSSEWPRLAMVRALNSQMTYADPVVYDWPHIKAKTLVMGGEKDGPTPNFPEKARHVADTIPNAKLVLFPNVGHNPHQEAPDQFHPVLVQFLKSDPGVRGKKGTDR